MPTVLTVGLHLLCSLGVETLWNNMREMQVQPDDELRAKVSFINILGSF